MNMKKLLLIILVALGYQTGAYAGYDEGMAAYVAGDFATALREWRPLAEAGDPRAQNKLGAMYGKGQGVSQNDATAVEWFRRAAEQGYAEAQNNLGYRLNIGRGVEADPPKALEWYRKAAAQGFAPAQYNLGCVYREGLYVPRDYGEALEWFRKAANQGHIDAQTNLGIMYSHGEGVTDYSKRQHGSSKRRVKTMPSLNSNWASSTGTAMVYNKMTHWLPSGLERQQIAATPARGSSWL